MNLEPLLYAPLPVWLHLITVLPAFGLGVWLIVISRKGATLHRLLGYLYLLLMSLTALLSLFITDLFGRWGPIHLLVPVTLAGVVSGFVAARRHDIHAHRRAMLLLFFGALVVAGGFTLMPGRRMNHVFFG